MFVRGGQVKKYKIVLVEQLENVIKENVYTDSLSAWADAERILTGIKRRRAAVQNDWEHVKLSVRVEES